MFFLQQKKACFLCRIATDGLTKPKPVFVVNLSGFNLEASLKVRMA